MATATEVIDWLEHGIPSDYVILKEGMQHFEHPKPITNIEEVTLSLLPIVRYTYPLGHQEIMGKENLYKDIIERLKQQA